MPIKPRIKSFHIAVQPLGSKFAKGLQQALRAKVINKVFRTAPHRVNGRSSFQVTKNPLNKIQQFTRFKDGNLSAPQFATTEQAARALNCKVLFARQLINSTNGRGIIEINRDAEVYPRAPLYTEYIPKRAEYRFHVFNGEVIDVQEKRKKRGDQAGEDFRVRNLHNGYVYCRDGVTPPADGAPLAISAVAACGYMYGAVDVIYNEKRGKCFVLEVNSRPGLMGTTLDKYAEALIKTYMLQRK